MTIRLTGLAALFAACFVMPAAAGEITAQQGREILQELKQIRQLLERPPAPAPAQAQAPLPERAKLKLGSEFALGQLDAPVTIVEFNDLQCPFCSQFKLGAFVEIRKQYIDTGKVRFINRDMPLVELHPQAIRAAQAARCAGDQGKYWEVAGKIIENNSSLTPQSIDGFAKDAGIDSALYQSCIESGRHLEAIRESAASAHAIGVSGTPSFLIGRVSGDTLEGQIMVGAQPFSSFDAMIKSALAK